MSFNSWDFLLFFPTVFFLYYAMPHRLRWQLLLTASCIFYMAFIPYYILILFATIIVDYLAGILIARSHGMAKEFYLYCSVIATCLILFFFKYFDFVALNINWLSKTFGMGYEANLLGIILPIGLSFHTFQSLSYVVEVYRGNQKPEKHFGIYSLYVLFFPQMVAGPIERPQNMLHQFHNKHTCPGLLWQRQSPRPATSFEPAFQRPRTHPAFLTELVFASCCAYPAVSCRLPSTLPLCAHLRSPASSVVSTK